LFSPLTFLFLKIISKTKRVLRGEVNARTAALETIRRLRVKNGRRKEQAQLAELNRQPARLREEFARLRDPNCLLTFTRLRAPNSSRLSGPRDDRAIAEANLP
jgi:hypothetical protein